MNPRVLFFKNLFSYTKERFPIPATLPYAMAFFSLAYFLPNLFSSKNIINLSDLISGSIIFFLITFQIRILDEHKDFKKDSVAHPERMLSKGIITLAQLRKVLYVIIAIQLGINICLGLNQLFIWFIIFIYTLLMFKEFFVPEFLNDRIGLYLISHQIIIPLMLLYGISMRTDICNMNSADTVHLMLFLFGSMLTTISYEIGRKTWSADREHDLADSYSKIWGIKKSVIINQVIALTAGLIFFYFYVISGIPVIHSIILAAFYLLFLISEIVFIRKSTGKNSKIIETCGAVYSLVIFINSSVAFYNL